MAVLQLNSLRTSFRTPSGIVKAVDGVSLEVNNIDALVKSPNILF